MKEYLTQMYKKHKKKTLFDSIDRIIPTLKHFFSYTGLISLVPTYLLKDNGIVPNHFLVSLLIISIIMFVAVSFGSLCVLAILAEIEKEKDKQFEKDMFKLLSSSKIEQELKEILLKANLIYFNSFEDNEFLRPEVFKTMSEQFKNSTFGQASIAQVAKLITEPEELQNYCEKNQKLIEMPYDELLATLKTRVANILVKEEIEREEKSNFIKENATNPNKEEALSKLNKKLALRL